MRKASIALVSGVALLALLLGALLVVFTGPAGALHVQPTLLSGNPRCEDFGALTEFKIEAPGNGTFSDGTLVVTISNFDGTFFDWETNFGVDAVVAKGGPDANLYTYSTLETSDTGLHSPTNPNTGQPYGLSHISFCNSPVNATTTTTSTTSTTVPTTTTTASTTTTTSTTVPPTTTTTVPATTTTSSTTTVVEVVGETVTTTTIASEVLPFTGPPNLGFGIAGVVLVVIGSLLVLATNDRYPHSRFTVDCEWCRLKW